MFINNNIYNDKLHYLEIGNSTYKLAVKSDDNTFNILRTNSPDEISNLIVDKKILIAITSQNVANYSNVDFEKSNLEIIEINKLFTFISDTYSPPESIGLDRILNLYGLENDSIVVSCGTAITIDSIKNNSPIWGAILPGFKVMFNSLNKTIPNLPTSDFDLIPKIPAKNTTDSIANGTSKALFYAISGIINEIELLYFNSIKQQIIITGGNALYLSNNLNSKSIIIEDLIFKGMERYYKLFCL